MKNCSKFDFQPIENVFYHHFLYPCISVLKGTKKPGSSVGELFLWRLPSPPLPLRCWTECWCLLQPPSLPEPLQVYDLCQARLSLASLFCFERGHCITRIALILRVNRLKPMLSGPPLSSEIKSLHYHLGDFSRPCPLTDLERDFSRAWNPGINVIRTFSCNKLGLRQVQRIARPQKVAWNLLSGIWAYLLLFARKNDFFTLSTSSFSPKLWGQDLWPLPGQYEWTIRIGLKPFNPHQFLVLKLEA